MLTIKRIYQILGAIFIVAGFGSLISLTITWDNANIGQRIMGYTSIGINWGLAWLTFRMAKSQSAMMMNPEEFNEVFNDTKSLEEEK